MPGSFLNIFFRRPLGVLTAALLPAAVLALASIAGCRDVPVDRLYSLHLDHAPTEADWATALPRLVTVRGGFANAPRRFGDIDEDTVHTSTASCHHGAALPEPLGVDMRSFYTDSEVFIRLSWEDPTRNDGMRRWTYDDELWSVSDESEDGFGLMWDAQAKFPRFTCSYACHIDDFGVSGANFHARNRMRLARRDALVDLWNWKADRTGRFGFADDRYLTDREMLADVPGEIFRPNSVAAVAGKEPFAEGDAPLYDDEERPVASRFQLPGAEAPGYITDRPAAGRADIKAASVYRDGRWTVVLRRALNTGDRRDVVFLPGDEAGVAFGLSVMDNTPDQHYASTTEERLILVAGPHTSTRSSE